MKSYIFKKSSRITSTQIYISHSSYWLPSYNILGLIHPPPSTRNSVVGTLARIYIIDFTLILYCDGRHYVSHVMIVNVMRVHFMMVQWMTVHITLEHIIIYGQRKVKC